MLRTKIILLLITIFTICLCSVYSQTIKKDSLIELSVTNNAIIEILEKLITNDKEADYYNPNLIYDITTRKHGQKILFTFSSINYLSYTGTEIGIFIYKNHKVIVCGSKIEQLKEFFNKLNTYHEIFYYEFFSGINSEGQISLGIIEDDSHTTWGYIFENNRFFNQGNAPCLEK